MFKTLFKPLMCFQGSWLHFCQGVSEKRVKSVKDNNNKEEKSSALRLCTL